MTAETGLKTPLFQSLFQLKVATRDILFWKHVSLGSIVDRMGMFSMGLGNKVMGNFKSFSGRSNFCLMVIYTCFYSPKVFCG